jgi:hypothetical protein
MCLTNVTHLTGSLKRSRVGQPEAQVLLTALRDSNLPKFLSDDAILFQAILSDLFPGVTLPEHDYGAMQVRLHSTHSTLFHSPYTSALSTYSPPVHPISSHPLSTHQLYAHPLSSDPLSTYEFSTHPHSAHPLHPQAAIEECVEAKGLILHPGQVKKVIQFYETMEVRHGVMLVGPTVRVRTLSCHRTSLRLRLRFMSLGSRGHS